jgi:hypothetical protein
MYTEINKLPVTSKVWIYQSDRILTQEEVNSLAEDTRQFVTSWTAHNQDLKGGFEIPFNAFLVIAVDESLNEASGCSLDKKFHFIRSAGERMGIDFLNRKNIAYLNNGELVLTNFDEFDKLLQRGEVNGDTIVFNNLVSSMQEYRQSWKIALKDSWHLQLLQKN